VVYASYVIGAALEAQEFVAGGGDGLDAAFGDFCANGDEVLQGAGRREASGAVFVGEIGAGDVECDEVGGGEGAQKGVVAPDEVQDSDARM